MFERYTEPARRVIFYARYEGLQFGSSEIDAEHILLGIHREARVLLDGLLQLPPESCLRVEIERLHPPKPASEAKDLPLSRSSRRSLAFAANEANILSSAAITPEHLLLGLLVEQSSLIQHFFPTPKASATVLRKQLPKGHHWYLRLQPWANFLSISFSCFLALLSVQVIGKSMTHTLPRTEVLPYIAAIGLAFWGAFSLAAVARRQLQIKASTERRRRVVALVIAALAAAYLAGPALLVAVHAIPSFASCA